MVLKVHSSAKFSNKNFGGIPQHQKQASVRVKKIKTFRLISIARLKTLLSVHLQPICAVVFREPNVKYCYFTRNLVLRTASRLYAFSAYPN